MKNFLFSSGRAVFTASPTMWKHLESAKNIATMQSYSWTFGYAQSAADALKEYGLVGVLGNMDQNFGWLPTYLSYYDLKEHSLVTRSDTPPFHN